MNRSLRRAEQVALVALVVTGLLTAAKFVVWVATSSLAVLSQALDSTLDVVVMGLVFVGVRVAAKPADREHHYGHAKAENLVVFTQTLILGVVVAGVAVEAVRRLSEGPGPVDVPWYAVALFGVSAVADAIRVRYLLRAAGDESSDALWAGALNLVTDVGTAVVTLGALLLVRAGVEGADAVGGLVVALAVAAAAIRLGKRSVDVLMDRAPSISAEAIAAAAERASGVSEARRVRVRGSGRQMFADVTVAAGRTASLERAHDISERVEEEVARVAPGTDVVVHVEPVSETSGLVERVQAAASRAEGVHEIHNVLVRAFDEAGTRKLHVTLHAKVSRGVSVDEAHGLADQVEEAVAAELGDQQVRVDSHIEPLEPTALGRDVTAERDDVVEAVRNAALEEPDVLDCHEVIVTATGGSLSIVAHVRGRGDLPLTRMHDASERIEKVVHSAHPEVGPVLIHFEPAT
jgi:cation diffusion facilitator family transporter